MRKILTTALFCLSGAAQAAVYDVSVQATFRERGFDGSFYDVTVNGQVSTDDDFIIDTGMFFFSRPNLSGEALLSDSYVGAGSLFSLSFLSSETQTGFGFRLSAPIQDVGFGLFEEPILSMIFDRSIVATLQALEQNEAATVGLSNSSLEGFDVFDEFFDWLGTEPVGDSTAGSATFTRLTAPAAVVPLPAGILLLTGGVAALGALRRAKRA
jgi:hypothetical protein